MYYYIVGLLILFLYLYDMQKNKGNNQIFNNNLIIIVASVLLWRGIWMISEIYIFPGAQQRKLSAITSMLLGVGLLTVTKTGSKILI